MVFFKQMAKHLVELDRIFLPACRNVLLTRDPHEMLTSFQVRIPDATLDDTGFPEMVEILDDTAGGRRGADRDRLDVAVAAPARRAGRLCDRLGLGFDDAMLTWPAGPKPEDGVWAPHWYDSVHRSTGWQPYVPKQTELLPNVQAAYEASVPLYERLLPYRIG